MAGEPKKGGVVTEPIAVGDVVQIHPAHHCLGGALAFVTEVRSWGIVAEVPVPTRGVAPVRLAPNEFVRIGHQAWEPES